MTHLFITRLAVAKVHPGHPTASPDRIRAIIKLWLEKASLFYTEQTQRSEFKVVLLYDSLHEATVKEFSYPAWAEPTVQPFQCWLGQQKFAGKPVTLSRVDADDSYSVDFFAYLDSLDFEAPRTLILHKKYLQYNMSSKLMLGPLHHYTPHFATLHFQSFPDFGQPNIEPLMRGDSVLHGIFGNHGSYHSRPHVTSPQCFALERITGWNVYNRFGKVFEKKVETEPYAELNERFVGY